MRIAILLLALRTFTIGGAKLGETVETFQDRYIDADCQEESLITTVCEEPGLMVYGHGAWLRGEFKGGKLHYVSYTLDAPLATAKRIEAAVRKEYGKPDQNYDYGMPESWTVNWQTDDELMQLTYTSAKQNGLGHPVVRLSLEGK